MKTLEDYEREIYHCCRCSACKFIAQPAISSQRFSNICPSIEDRNFHVYSGGGKLAMAYALLKGKVEYTDEMLDAIYRCTMGGACDIQCRVNMGDMIDVNEILHALRVKCVEGGQILPEHQLMVDNMRKEDNPFGKPKAARGDWAEGLGLKDASREKVDVLFHAGCRFSYDEDLKDIVRADAAILKEAGVDLGISGKDEACCGLRAFDTGFRGEMEKYAEDISTRVKSAGATKLVTPCADCFSAFKYYYPWIGVDLGVEILHITEYFDRLISEGKIELRKEFPLTVTYHDPCHLGRLGEPYEVWEGQWKKVLGQMCVSDPAKPLRTGVEGVYEPPRNIIKKIPGLKLVEMERTRENTWCCGAGGGALEAFEAFSHRTAMERIAEAKSTGAEVLVTACPWCERNFRDAIKESGEEFKVYDIAELLMEVRK